MGSNFSKNGVLEGSVLENKFKDNFSMYGDTSVPKNLVNINTCAVDSGNITINKIDYGYTATESGTNLYRISPLGLDGDGTKTYTVSFYIKGNKSGTIVFDLCDQGSTSVNVTNEWQKVVFSAKPIKYYNESLGYNGFLDIYTMPTGLVVDIRYLKIEEGVNTNPIFIPYGVDDLSLTNVIEASELVEY